MAEENKENEEIFEIEPVNSLEDDLAKEINAIKDVGPEVGTMMVRVFENWFWKKKTSLPKIPQEMKIIPLSYSDSSEEKFVLKGGLKNNSNLTTMMGMWDDVLYPDNENRERRVYELANDINSYSVELAGKTEKLDSLFTILNQKLEELGDDLDYPELKQKTEIPIYE
ncbi:27083_t:CDS:1, partial [Dentiscutata erythropus]